MPDKKPAVMMVTGAYYPELSGAGLQCRTLVRRLKDDVHFTVLTTTADRSLPVEDSRDGVPVYRVFINPASWWSKIVGTVRITRVFLRLAPRFSIVHLHGFSQKSMLLIALARIMRKRLAIKLTSVGHDDPVSMKRRGMVAYWLYAGADVFFAVSERLRELYEREALPSDRLLLIPNGVDCRRFHPPAPGERDLLRRQLGFPTETRIVLFVGFFSSEKCPNLLFDAWAKVALSAAPDTTLVFVGATRSTYYEVDSGLAERIHESARALGLDRRVRFVEVTQEIELFHRAADVFVLPSLREGMPNALLEAMASGAACIASRLEGVTDAVITDGQNGVLVPPGDPSALEAALRRCLADRQWSARLGAEARRTIEDGYGIDGTAAQYLQAYRRLQISSSACAA